MTARSHTRTRRAEKRKARRRLAALQPPPRPVDRRDQLPSLRVLNVPSLTATALSCTCGTGAVVRAAVAGAPIEPCSVHAKEQP